jgi:carboxymethylenebutenolidase
MGEVVDVGTARGYLARDEGASPGLLVLHEGGERHAHAVCDRFAAEGFTALALSPAGADLEAAVDFLLDHAAVRGHGVGVVGFGPSGAAALALAAARPAEVSAVVPFHGTWAPGPPPAWGRITSPVEGHYGEGGEEEVATIESELAEAGTEVRLFTYVGAGPGFFDDTRRDGYVEDAARQAWVRTLEFLRAKLG